MRRFVPIPVLLALLGASLLVVGFSTPRFSDEVTAERALDDLSQQWGQHLGTSAEIESQGYTDRFFNILQQYETHRWPLIDLGYLALAWSTVAGVVIAFRWRPWRRLTRLAPAMWLTAMALLLFWLGLVADPVYASAREQLPYWADTIGIPIISSTVGMLRVSPIVALALLLPFLRRTVQGSLVEAVGYWPPRWRLLPMLLVYGPLAVGFAILLFWSLGPSGWATSVAGGMLLWLTVNAASVWLAPRRAKLSES